MKLDIYVDGSIIGNPGGTGAWAAIIVFGRKYRPYTDYEFDTTNNRMEMQAIIEGITAYSGRGNKRIEATVHSDSEYVLNGFLKGWIDKWATNNWKRKKGKRWELIPNHDLWIKLARIDDFHDLRWVHHHGHERDSYCKRAYLLDDIIGIYGTHDYWMWMAHEYALTEARLRAEEKKLAFPYRTMPENLEERWQVVELIRSVPSPPDPPYPERPVVWAVYQKTAPHSERLSGPLFLPIEPSKCVDKDGLPDGGRYECERAAATMNETDDTKLMEKFRRYYLNRYVVRPHKPTIPEEDSAQRESTMEKAG